MSIRTRVVASGVAITLAAGALIAWTYWPPLLRYRADLALGVARETVARYLAGDDSLSSAARRLGVAMQNWERLIQRTESAPPLNPGSLRAEIIGITPEGVAQNDPRVEELALNALRFSVPPDMPAGFRKESLRQLDSLILARGHRLAP